MQIRDCALRSRECWYNRAPSYISLSFTSFMRRHAGAMWQLACKACAFVKFYLCPWRGTWKFVFKANDWNGTRSINTVKRMLAYDDMSEGRAMILIRIRVSLRPLSMPLCDVFVWRLISVYTFGASNNIPFCTFSKINSLIDESLINRNDSLSIEHKRKRSARIVSAIHMNTCNFDRWYRRRGSVWCYSCRHRAL